MNARAHLMALGLSVLLAAVGCRGGGRAADRRPAEESRDAVTRSGPITWNSAFGPGGATVPDWPLLLNAEEASLTFSHLVGVVLDPDRNDLLLVGSRDDRSPTLDADALMDAFRVALRALPDAPGVSIDPTPSQLGQGLKEGDSMTVRYIGGNERTVVGYAAFEADRIMKCLSLGKDNITGQPVTCRVPGYRSEIDASVEEPTGSEEWHRFWIVQVDNPLDLSDDGRTLVLNAQLKVHTEYMVARNGQLVPGNRPPSAAAREFAEHLSINFDEYAREFGVFHELEAYAQMVALAHGLTGDWSSSYPHVSSSFDFDAFIGGGGARVVDTPLTTPATVAVRETVTTSPSARHVRRLSLTGGVDLKPHLNTRPRSPVANQLQTDVLTSARRQNRGSWALPRGDDTLVVVRRHLGTASLRLWQTDMVVGPAVFARVSTEGDSASSIGRHWHPSVPELTFSSETIAVEALGTMPRFAELTTRDGERITMRRPATLQMPGQGSTPGYIEPQQGRRRPRRLYRFRNVIVLEDGEIQYVSVNGGPPERRIPEGASVVEFSPDAPHRAQRVHTHEGSVDLLWDGNRFLGYLASSGERIDVQYDATGAIVGLRGSNGKVVDYRFDRFGRLLAAVDEAGRTVAYRLAEQDGRPSGVWGEFSDVPGGASVNYNRFEVSAASPPSSLREAAAALSDQDTVFIGLMDAPAGTGRAMDVVVGSREVVIPMNLERLIEAVLDVENGQGTQSAWLRQALLESDAARQRPNVVVVGPPYMRNYLARALARIAPDRRVSTAANPRLAAANLRALGRGRRGFQHVHVAEGLDASINAGIASLRAGHRGGGDLVVVTGHNSRQFKAQIESLSRAGALKGKSLLLVTCGTSGTGAHDALLEHAGVSQVLAFEAPINVQVLEPFMKELYRRLDASRAPQSTVVRRVVDEVIETLKQDDQLKPLIDEIKVLDLRHYQIGRWVPNPDRPWASPDTGLS